MSIVITALPRHLVGAVETSLQVSSLLLSHSEGFYTWELVEPLQYGHQTKTYCFNHFTLVVGFLVFFKMVKFHFKTTDYLQ